MKHPHADREPNKPGDSVDHPAHYNKHPAGIETIEVIEHMTLNLGTAIKYLWRAGLKEIDATEEDLDKAIWYIQREKARLFGRPPVDILSDPETFETHQRQVDLIKRWDTKTPAMRQALDAIERARTGVVAAPAFSTDPAADVKEAVDNLKADGVTFKGFELDMRVVHKDGARGAVDALDDHTVRVIWDNDTKAPGWYPNEDVAIDALPVPVTLEEGQKL